MEISKIKELLKYLNNNGTYKLDACPEFNEIYKLIIEYYTSMSSNNSCTSRIKSIIHLQKINNQYITVSQDREHKNRYYKSLLMMNDNRLLGLLKDYEYNCKKGLEFVNEIYENLKVDNENELVTYMKDNMTETHIKAISNLLQNEIKKEDNIEFNEVVTTINTLVTEKKETKKRTRNVSKNKKKKRKTKAKRKSKNAELEDLSSIESEELDNNEYDIETSNVSCSNITKCEELAVSEEEHNNNALSKCVENMVEGHEDYTDNEMLAENKILDSGIDNLERNLSIDCTKLRNEENAIILNRNFEMNVTDNIIQDNDLLDLNDGGNNEIKKNNLDACIKNDAYEADIPKNNEQLQFSNEENRCSESMINIKHFLEEDIVKGIFNENPDEMQGKFDHMAETFINKRSKLTPTKSGAECSEQINTTINDSTIRIETSIAKPPVISRKEALMKINKILNKKEKRLNTDRMNVTYKRKYVAPNKPQLRSATSTPEKKSSEININNSPRKDRVENEVPVFDYVIDFASILEKSRYKKDQ